MFGLGFGEIFVVLAIALIFIGPKKIPELARGLGKALREFQKAKDDFMSEVSTEKEQTPFLQAKAQKETVARSAEEKKDEKESKNSADS